MSSKSKYAARIRIFIAVLAGIALSGTCAEADQIVLNNGDRITGTIDSADGGKIIITSPIEGKVTVDIKNVKTFNTDGPIKIQLEDGTVLNEKITEGPDGTIVTAEGGSLPAQPVPLASIDKMNPPPETWTGSIAINGLLAHANTDTLTFGATLDAQRRGVNDRITAGAQYLLSSQKQNGVKTTTQDTWYVA